MTFKRGQIFRPQRKKGAAALSRSRSCCSAANVDQSTKLRPLAAGKKSHSSNTFDNRCAGRRAQQSAQQPGEPVSFRVFAAGKRNLSLLNKAGFVWGLALLLLGVALLSYSTAERDPMPSVLLLSEAVVTFEGLAVIALVVSKWSKCLKSLQSRSDPVLIREPQLENSIRSDLRVLHRGPQ
jgi:hypothetical protein